MSFHIDIIDEEVSIGELFSAYLNCSFKMHTQELIKLYLENLPPGNKEEMKILHELICNALPDCKLWFLDGRDENGKVVSNPNIGYGQSKLKYKDGSSKDFYRVGISANTSGISVYFMGIEDKTFLANTYGQSIGKAKITGYCIKFSTLKHIHMDVLVSAIQDVVHRSH